MLLTYRQFIFYTFIPLMLGTIIYIFFRPSNLILNSWLIEINIKPIYLTNSFLRQIFFSLPFSLWAIAFINTILLIWQYKISKSSVFWILNSLMISPTIEVLQIWELIPGTFDLYDLIFLLWCISVFLLSIKHKLKILL